MPQFSPMTKAIMAGSALAGGAYGVSRARENTDGGVGLSVVQGGIDAAIAAGVGGLAWANRDGLSSAAWSISKGIGKAGYKSASTGVKQAFKAKSLTGMLTGPMTVMGIGAIAGGFIGSKMDHDSPVRGAAAGAAVGTVSAVAARGATRMWKGGNVFTKTAMLAVGTVGAMATSRAFTHEEAYAAEDHAVSDGTGGYESAPGVRQRMDSMNAKGDIVLGLHRGRH